LQELGLLGQYTPLDISLTHIWHEVEEQYLSLIVGLQRENSAVCPFCKHSKVVPSALTETIENMNAIAKNKNKYFLFVCLNFLFIIFF